MYLLAFRIPGTLSLIRPSKLAVEKTLNEKMLLKLIKWSVGLNGFCGDIFGTEFKHQQRYILSGMPEIVHHMVWVHSSPLILH